MVIGQGQELPAEVSDDDRGDDGQPDLLQCLQPPRPIPDTVLGRDERDEKGDERRRDPVIEPAFDVERPADPHRNSPVGHDRQAERRVGGRQDGGEQRGRRPLDTGENEISHQRAGRNREWQPHKKQPVGQAGVALDVTQPDRGGIGEQQQGQRQLSDGEDRLVAQREGQNIQHARAQDRARGDEHHRGRDPPPVKLGRHEGVNRHQNGQSSQTTHQTPSPCCTVLRV